MDDPLLLNYMYQKGYTEEDMYDTYTIIKVQGSFGFLAYKIKLGMKTMAERIAAVFKRIKEIFTKAFAEMAETSKEKKVIPVTFGHGTNFMMKSQVITNKPRYVVRKIIR